MRVDYTPDGETLRRFMRSTALVRGLQGPIGSGKSVACVIECLRLKMGQLRAFDPATVREVSHGVFEGERTGKRRVRIGVVRNTTPQLETTTMKTWLEWLPERDFGPADFAHPLDLAGAECLGGFRGHGARFAPGSDFADTQIHGRLWLRDARVRATRP